jgi:predicted RNA-binding Zn-ribbon protein involved in translation (DUF1610 family)
MAAYCVNCGNALPVENAKFCPNCGAAQESDQREANVVTTSAGELYLCPQCGGSGKIKQAECGYCLGSGKVGQHKQEQWNKKQTSGGWQCLVIAIFLAVLFFVLFQLMLNTRW